MIPSRFSEFKFRNGKIAKNRVVIPPMASQTADAHGFVTDKTLAHYHRLSAAGAGIVIVEYSHIHLSGRGEENQLGVYSDDQIIGLTKIAKTIQASGGLAGLQIVHVGGKTTTEITGSSLMAPSEIAVPVKGWLPKVPTAMSKVQILNWVDWFAAAAHRAHRAGFDIVELHAAHGYGLNQWLSPITNHRGDQYGHSIEGRSRLLFEIVKRIRMEIPEILLAVRLPAQDHADYGLELDQMIWVAQQLEIQGVDLIDVSSGIGGWRRPEDPLQKNTTEGYLVQDAAALKSRISLPVIGVGGIETGSYIDQILAVNKVDFAAVGRAILRDPSGWSQQQLEVSSVSGA